MNQYMGFVQKTMDYAQLKNKLIADNIANYNTPDYKSKQLTGKPVFEMNLQEGQSSEGLKKTNSKHLSSSKQEDDMEIVTNAETKERFDGNNVDMNLEMMELIKNNSLYKYSVEAINKEMNLHRIALGRN